MEILTRILWAVLPSLCCGVVLFFFQKSANKREAKHDKMEERRKEESLLLLKMSFANGELGYAAAMALKRGTPNGEVEEAIKAYSDAKGEYNKFINRVHVEEMMEGDR